MSIWFSSGTTCHYADFQVLLRPVANSSMIHRRETLLHRRPSTWTFEASPDGLDPTGPTHLGHGGHGTRLFWLIVSVHVTISKSLIPWYPMYQENLPVHWNYHLYRNQLEIINCQGPCLSAFVWTPNHRTSMPSAAGRTLMQKASASLTVGSPADGSQLWIYYICYSAGKVDGSYEYMHPLIRLQLTQSD